MACTHIFPMRICRKRSRLSAGTLVVLIHRREVILSHSTVEASITVDMALTSPVRLPLLDDLSRPLLRLLEREARSDVRELAQIKLPLAPLLVFNHLQQQLHLVDVMHEVAVKRLAVLILLPQRTNLLARLLARLAAPKSLEQVPRQVVHGLSLAARLLGLRHAVDGRDVADQALGHVVDEAHARALVAVDAVAQGRGAQHADHGHAVHVVGDGLAARDAEAPPALALGRLEPLEHVEVGDRGGGVLLGRAGRDGREDLGYGPVAGDLGGDDYGGVCGVVRGQVSM